MTKNKKSKESKIEKCRVVEYSQQLEYMEKNGIPTDKDKLEKYVKKQFPNASEYLTILHDKDFTEKDEPVKPHFHIFLLFTDPKSASFVAKKFHDKENRVELWNKNHKEKQSDLNAWNCAISYACHLTSKARKENKHQYSPDEARTSIKNYAEVLEKIEKEVSEKADKLNEKARMMALTNASGPTGLLDGYRDGLLSYEDIMQYTTASQRKPSFMSHLNSITKEILDEKYKKFKKEMKETGQQVVSILCFGPTATGKTRWAKNYAIEKYGEDDYYLAGSNRDLFAGYRGESIIIIDELRPDVINYGELLKLLDPFNFENVFGSRYHDKALIAKEIIITGPLSPTEFYVKVINDDNVIVLDEKGAISEVHTSKNIDSPEQFFRRINVMKFTKDFIIPQYFDEEKRNYQDVEEQKITNKWSAIIPHKTKDQVIETFSSVFSVLDDDAANDNVSDDSDSDE